MLKELGVRVVVDLSGMSEPVARNDPDIEYRIIEGVKDSEAFEIKETLLDVYDIVAPILVWYSCL